MPATLLGIIGVAEDTRRRHRDRVSAGRLTTDLKSIYYEIAVANTVNDRSYR